MNSYSGKFCPYCRKELDASSAPLVVCDTCGEVYHKECWDTFKGCSTFLCKGTAKPIQPETTAEPSAEAASAAADTSSQIQQTPDTNLSQYCNNCGAQNKQSDSFCIKCGKPLTAPAQDNTTGTKTTPADQSSSISYNKLNNPNSSYSYSSYFGLDTSGNGANTQNSDQQEKSRSDDRDLDLYLQKNIFYYKNSFRSLKTNHSKSSWNWAAFLFTDL